MTTEVTPLNNPDPENNKNHKKKTKIQEECDIFLDKRWRWLLLLYSSLVPILIFGLPSKLVLWVIINAFGYMYVSAGTCDRPNPIASRNSNNGNREFIKIICAAPITYLVGAHWTLLDSTNTSNIIIFEGFGLNEYQDPTPYITASGFWIYFIYNFFAYITPFFIGLHFSYLDFFPFLQKIVFDARGIASFRPGHWILICSGAALLLTIIIQQLDLMYVHGKLKWFALTLAIVAVFFAAWCVYNIKKLHKKVHIHHYQIGLILISFTINQNVVSAVLQGVATGVYVEGIARWSMGSAFDD